MPQVRSLSELLTATLGVNTFSRTNDALSSVGVTAARILKQDGNRIAATIVNLSVNDVYVGPFSDVSTTKGIYLGPGGGNVTILWSEMFGVVGWEWMAIASAVSSAVIVIEQILLNNPVG